MMLAFLVDQTQQLCCALCQAVWTKMGSKRLVVDFVNPLQVVTTDAHVEHMV
jgi:hypothetical protein